MAYLLVLVVLSGGNTVINQPLRIGSFHSLEICERFARKKCAEDSEPCSDSEGK